MQVRGSRRRKRKRKRKEEEEEEEENKKKGKPWQEMGFHRPRDVTERRWIHCLLI